MSAIQFACASNHADCLQLLLNHNKIDVSEGNVQGAFYNASKYGHSEYLAHLLDDHNVKIDINHENRETLGELCTSLQNASASGHADCVSILVGRDEIDLSKSRQVLIIRKIHVHMSNSWKLV